MKIAIHQPQYMPWVGYFHKMASVDVFVFLDDVQFKKNEWQHRNRIRNAQGWQWLSVPTSYKFPQRIHEVRVKSELEWEKKHLRSLEMCYGKARFFDEYIDAFRRYYLVKRETMSAVAIDSVCLLADLMGIQTRREVSSSYAFEGVSTGRLVSICRHFNADTYL
ncbi:MAG: hypothetical protein GF418_14105, partial [Chitinivibrionales bacterium]|nr:hypothetical protein [Chitinivibrionales bacterium]MBD3396752.1 hypothetical protein [Chitinivibrionales bacterium]